MPRRLGQAELVVRGAAAPRTASTTRSYAATSSGRRTSASAANSRSWAAADARTPPTVVPSSAVAMPQPAAPAAAAAANDGNMFRQILAPVRRLVGRARSTVAAAAAAIQPSPIAGAPSGESNGTLTANHTAAYAPMARSTTPAALAAYRYPTVMT